jgi:hypothetical protein
MRRRARRSAQPLDLMDTSALLAAVADQSSFLAFARALKADREHAAKIESDPSAVAGEREVEAWQNVTIESFLGAAIAWAEDSRFGASQGLKHDNPWKKFAVFLQCGKMYE